MAQGREFRYDASCPSCGTGVMSIASRCKICGAPLGRAAAPAAPPPGAPVDAIQRAHDRRAERAAGETATPRRARLVLTLVGIAGVVGTVTAATWIAVSHAHSDSRSDLAAASPAKDPPAVDPAAPPPDPQAQAQTQQQLPFPPPGMPSAPSGPSAPQASPFPLPSPGQPGMPPGFAMPPGFSMPSMPSLRNLMRSLGPGVGADPAAQKFADEAMSLVCEKAASCGLFDASDRAACDMFAGTLVSGALAGALSGRQCHFNPAKAQGCIQVLRGIDCQSGGGSGGMDVMNLLSAIQGADSCADTLACL